MTEPDESDVLITRTVSFREKSAAVNWILKVLKDPLLTSISFLNKSWYKKGEKGKYEIRSTFIGT